MGWLIDLQVTPTRGYIVGKEYLQSYYTGVQSKRIVGIKPTLKYIVRKDGMFIIPSDNGQKA